jgi:hypothetical protein
MKKLCVVICVGCVLLFGSSNVVFASAWDTCKGCHNGSLAPDEKRLKEKHPTAEKFVEAAKKSDDPFMGEVKKDVKLLQEAARDIGLKLGGGNPDETGNTTAP